jgi:hypothetical protein
MFDLKILTEAINKNFPLYIRFQNGEEVFIPKPIRDKCSIELSKLVFNELPKNKSKKEKAMSISKKKAAESKKAPVAKKKPAAKKK